MSFTQNLPMNRLFAGVMAESLPEDICLEILLRLPVKSLMRFKCVSKRWWSLISDPGFAKSHLQRLKAGDLIPSQRIMKGSNLVTIDYEALDGRDDAGEVELHSPHKDYSFRRDSDMVGSCDGLVCLLVRRNLLAHQPPTRDTFLVHNPATRKCRELGGSNFVLPHVFRGFGYDSRSDDYKIVQGHIDDDTWVVEIFSIKSGSWRMIEFQFEEESHLEIRGLGVYWNGAIHWFVVEHDYAHGSLIQRGAIMSFDLSEERFHRKIQIPEVDADIVLVGIGIHEASLFIYSGGNDPHIEAWIMDEHDGGGGSWTRWFSFDCPYWNFALVLPNYVIPIAYTRSGKIVLRMEMEERDTEDMSWKYIQRMYMMQPLDPFGTELMILFNPEDHSWKYYPIKGSLIKHAIYLETLVSPYLGIDPSRISSL